MNTQTLERLKEQAMLKEMCEWQNMAKKENGILVGCDFHQEWLLGWWWERFSAVNAFPVTFIDFGMTESARKWCQHRGEVVSLLIDSSFVKSKDEIDLAEANTWEKLYGPTLWTARANWFKKPFACLHSPYKKTLWIDVDCEILKPLNDLFSTCLLESPLAMVREYGAEHLAHLHPGIYYNGGVMVFMHGAEIIRKWASASLVRNGHFWSDDNLLSALICECKLPIIELEDLYNWKYLWGFNIEAKIYHWVGTGGKTYIKNYGGIKPALQAFHRALQG